MKHVNCVNYISLDCEKGMCALSKQIVPIDGVGSDACPKYEAAKKCRNCACFKEPDKYGIGTCTGFEKENWAYAGCGAFCCGKYQARG